MLDAAIRSQIEALISENDVVLFMKGTPELPRCASSKAAARTLARLQVPFKDIDVLQDETLRQGIKTFSNWQTLPQLYVQGEFVGGYDIMRDMRKRGELEPFLRERGLAPVDNES